MSLMFKTKDSISFRLKANCIFSSYSIAQESDLPSSHLLGEIEAKFPCFHPVSSNPSGLDEHHKCREEKSLVYL